MRYLKEQEHVEGELVRVFCKVLNRIGGRRDTSVDEELVREVARRYDKALTDLQISNLVDVVLEREVAYNREIEGFYQDAVALRDEIESVLAEMLNEL